MNAIKECSLGYSVTSCKQLTTFLGGRLVFKVRDCWFWMQPFADWAELWEMRCRYSVMGKGRKVCPGDIWMLGIWAGLVIFQFLTRLVSEPANKALNSDTSFRVGCPMSAERVSLVKTRFQGEVVRHEDPFSLHLRNSNLWRTSENFKR